MAPLSWSEAFGGSGFAAVTPAEPAGRVLWGAAPRVPRLLGEEVHLWRVPLEQPMEPGMARVLTADERRRADRYRRGSDRYRFLFGRVALRCILARYLGRAPEEVVFRCGATGKPELARAVGNEGLRFNLSHSRGLGVYVIARGRRVGIDVEALRPVPECCEIAARFFSRREAEELRALPPDARAAAFLHGWTQKEACLKATGAGLTRALAEVEVSMDPAAPARLLAVRGSRREKYRWWLHALRPASGYVGALAVERRNRPRTAP